METIQYPLRTIHVDDELSSIQSLKKMIEKMPDIDYLDGFLTADEALVFLEKEHVDLILCDVEMPGNDGLWLANQIIGKNIQLVFLTNHTDYASRAFEACALDYILKPINENNLSIMLEKVKYSLKENLTPKSEQIEEVYNYIDTKVKPQRIFVNTLNAIIVIKLEDVIYFSSSLNYTNVVMNNGDKQTISKTIKSCEEILKFNPDFVRVSRFYVINKNHVKLIKKSKTRQFLLVMTNGDELESSLKTKEEILKKLSDN